MLMSYYLNVFISRTCILMLTTLQRNFIFMRSIQTCVLINIHVYTHFRPKQDSFEEAKQWARALRDSQWNFDRGCENDVIIVVSRDDTKVYLTRN